MINHLVLESFKFTNLTISEPHEETVDPLYSIALSSKSVPMVSVKQTMTKLLGPPYHSQCLNSGYKLKYFELYTEKHCFHECSVEAIANQCGCRLVVILEFR